jgi:predicted Zn-dependent peptidase
LSPDPRARLRDQFETVLFGRTTYGRPLKGTPDTVQGITVGDVRYFYNKHFSPNAASLVVTGRVDPEKVIQKASRIWGLWIRKDPIPFTFAPARKPAEDVYLIEDDPDSPAVQFIFGNFAPERQDLVFVNTTIAVRILQGRLRNILPTALLNVGLDGRRLP